MADYAAPNNAIETRDDLGTDPGGRPPTYRAPPQFEHDTGMIDMMMRYNGHRKPPISVITKWTLATAFVALALSAG